MGRTRYGPFQMKKLLVIRFKNNEQDIITALGKLKLQKHRKMKNINLVV